MFLQSYQNSLTVVFWCYKKRYKARITVIIIPCALIFGCELDRADRCHADRCKWLMLFIEGLLQRPTGLQTTRLTMKGMYGRAAEVQM